MFDQTFITNSGKRRPWTYALGVTGELFALGLMMLLPLVYTDQISVFGFSKLPIFVPRGREPKPVEMARTGRQAARPAPDFRTAALVYNRSYPARPAVIIDPIDTAGIVGVPDAYNGPVGIPAGLGSNHEVGPPPPEEEAKPAPEPRRAEKPEVIRVRQGGDVMAAKIIRKVLPVYPPLARQTRVQGVVRLMGVISRDGTIQQLQVLSGHPLLVESALAAVRQWVYRPTLLNKEPVEVQAPIDVNFVLSQ